MNKLNGKKGFTLIELLAVIVVLAIVAVLGASLILPALANARRDAFVTESNNFVDAASQGISLIQVGSITNQELTDIGSDYKLTEDTTEGTKTYCFTMIGLVKLGLFDKKLNSDNKIPDYEGIVKVTVKNNSKLYTYTTTMTNKNFYVKEKVGNITADDVKEYSTGETYTTSGIDLTVSC